MILNYIFVLPVLVLPEKKHTMDGLNWLAWTLLLDQIQFRRFD